MFGVVTDERLTYSRAIGVRYLSSKQPVTVNTLFRIASMTKAFTALTVLKLRDEGRVNLDAPAELYIPELQAWVYPTGTRRGFASATCSTTPPASSQTIPGQTGKRCCRKTNSRSCCA